MAAEGLLVGAMPPPREYIPGLYPPPPEPPQDHPVWVVLLALSLIVFLYL